MTDVANVSTHVSEEEMSTIQGLFARAANAIVDVSRLSVQVKELEGKVGELTNSVTSYRNQIQWQDDMISRMRLERDNAKETVSRANQDRDSAVAELNASKNELNILREHEQRQKDTITTLMKERDDAMFHNLELEERAKKAEDALAKVRESIANIFPTPTPSVVEQAYASVPTPLAVQAPTEVSPQVEETSPAPSVVSAVPEGQLHWHEGRLETEEEHQRRVGIDQPRNPRGEYKSWDYGTTRDDTSDKW